MFKSFAIASVSFVVFFNVLIESASAGKVTFTPRPGHGAPADTHGAAGGHGQPILRRGR